MFIYNEEDIRKIDNTAVEQGFSIYTLMENAGRGLFYKIKSRISPEDRIVILAGKGNNGGDGIVLARYLKQHGYDVDLTFPLGNPTSETAIQHLDYYTQQGYDTQKWNKDTTYEVIIDSLLGIGTKLPLRADVKEIISWGNDVDALKIAIDLPTGVVADHGETEKAFRADYTFCLHGVKPSAFLLPSMAFYGTFQAVDIGLAQTSNIRVTNIGDVTISFPQRGSATHKGTFGTGLLVAGSDEMPGSALLGAIGAMRTGVGKLITATSSFAASIIAPTVPESTYLFDGLKKIADGHIPEKLAAIAIGPGIDDKDQVHAALKNLLKLDVSLVVDAGALIRLDSWKRPNPNAPTIITPHPGEFSRLTGKSIKEIQANRIQLATNFSQTNNVTVVLKGKYTVIAYPDGKVLINPTGNSGLAKGGSGDVLTGMIVSMLATHENWQDAIGNAVFIHGLCAEKWGKNYSETSMTASDYDTLLPIVLREIEYEQM